MDAEVKATLGVLRELRLNGKIAQLRRARKVHTCDECGLPIKPGTHYYCVYLGGAGLGNLKFPDHVHIECIDKNLKSGGKNDNGKSTS